MRSMTLAALAQSPTKWPAVSSGLFTCAAPEEYQPLSGWLGAYVTPKTLKRYNSKWPELGIFFILDLFLTKGIKIIFV